MRSFLRGAAPDPWLAHEVLPDELQRVEVAAGDVGDALELARLLGRTLRPPGEGRTWSSWSTLASIAAYDLTLARVVEPHLDALAIISQAGQPDLAPVGVDETSTWGVFAAEGPAPRLSVERDGPTGARLTGLKSWCSLAGRLTHALVTAWVSPEERCLYAVDLRDPGVRLGDTPWVGRGLANVRTGPVEFADVAAVAVGTPGWYLTRPGFAWGGIGVAACWYGGAVGVGRALLSSGGGRAPDQVASMHLGAVDAALFSAGCAVREAAERVDAGRATGPAGALLALRTRQVVADGVDTVVRQVDHALGPAPLAFDEEHARRVDDLRLYVRQHHAERDTAALGTHLFEHGGQAR